MRFPPAPVLNHSIAMYKHATKKVNYPRIPIEEVKIMDNKQKQQNNQNQRSNQNQQNNQNQRDNQNNQNQRNNQNR